jgi:hypothetical protein
MTVFEGSLHGHPEFVSGSAYSDKEMPKQVRHDGLVERNFWIPAFHLCQGFGRQVAGMTRGGGGDEVCWRMALCSTRVILSLFQDLITDLDLLKDYRRVLHRSLHHQDLLRLLQHQKGRQDL